MADGVIVAVLVILVVVVVGIIIFVVVRERRPHGTTCDPASSTTCDSGLTCDTTTRTCKVPIGGTCTVLSDCVTGTVECRPLTGTNSVCQSAATGTLGQSCSVHVGATSCLTGLTCDNLTTSGSQTCRRPDGQPCTANTDCLTGSTCSTTTNVCTSTSNPPAPLFAPQPMSYMAPPPLPSAAMPPVSYMAPPLPVSYALPPPIPYASPPVVDLIYHAGRVLQVLPDGRIVEERSGRTHRTDLPLSRVVTFNGYLYGLAQGRLFELAGGTDETQWRWELAEWAPSSLVFISASHDGQTLWLQTPHEGYIVRKKQSAQPQRADLTPGTWRVYGRDERQWLDLSLQGVVDESGRRYPAEAATPYAAYAVHDRDGRVVVARPPDTRVRLIDADVRGF